MGKKFWYIVLFIILVIIVAGCDTMGGKDYNNENEKEGNQTANEKVLSIDPDPRPEEYTFTLYFKHKFSDYLIPEIRTAIRDKQSVEQLLVEELLKGPSQHDRISIMPAGVKVLDVTRKGETVFVNLSQEFTDEISLNEIPGKEEIPEDRRATVKAEMKRLGIYSIVDSLTELEGVNQVKFLVENRGISYTDMDKELGKLLFPESAESEDGQFANAVLVALGRDRSYILTPSKSVDLVFKGLVGEPKWDRVYPLLAKETMGKDSLPSKEELASLWSAVVASIELESAFIIDEEIKPDGKAFVTVSYNVTFTSGKKEKRQGDMISVVDEDNIWKVKLPDFVSEFR